MKRICRPLGGRPLTYVIRQLKMNPKKVAISILKGVERARKNARLLRVGAEEDLVVAHFLSGRLRPVKIRPFFRSHGRVDFKQKHRCMLTVIVKPEKLMVGKKWVYIRRNREIKERRILWKSGQYPPPKLAEE